ncbi:anti-sigma factor family protein [Bacillus fonticola]|uniref:anti-sigma factor family protein n=1 Tax=Bacillus fonticola TaxID=2728853 RepID=UPI002AD35FA3|nr:zf-HC2 domain-containing protein [Bacillus fonticola]
MNECPKEIIDYIHDYLDGDLDAEKETVLQEYLSSCAACRAHFRELERTISFIQSTPSVQAPEGFTAGVFARLPKEKKTTRARRWFRYHPMLTAASVFLLLMVTSLVGSFGDTNEFSFTNYDNVIVEGTWWWCQRERLSLVIS